MSLRRTWMLAGLLACAATALGDESGRTTRGSESGPQTANEEAAIGPAHSAARWLGLAIRSRDGEEVARVEDFAFDLEEGCVGFVVAKLTNSAQSDSHRIGLPLELLSPSGRTLTARCSTRDLRQAPQLENSDWVGNVTRLWAMDVYEYFELHSPWKQRQALELWSPKAEFGRLFNPDRIRTVEGKIARVDYVPPLPEMSVGVQLTLKSGDRDWQVQLGPLWYLSRQEIKFKPDQQVTVTGSEITLSKRPMLVAAKIEVGKQKLRLRDKDGSVAWQSWTSEDASRRFVRMTDLRDNKVCNDGGDEVGRIRDFALAEKGNLIAYAALSLADHPKASKDGAEQWCAIPLGAFVVKPDSEQWVLELPEKMLVEMPRFKSDAKWPEQLSRGWIEYVHVRYGRSAVGGVRSEERGETRHRQQ